MGVAGRRPSPWRHHRTHPPTPPTPHPTDAQRHCRGLLGAWRWRPAAAIAFWCCRCDAAGCRRALANTRERVCAAEAAAAAAARRWHPPLPAPSPYGARCDVAAVHYPTFARPHPFAVASVPHAAGTSATTALTGRDAGYRLERPLPLVWPRRPRAAAPVADRATRAATPLSARAWNAGGSILPAPSLTTICAPPPARVSSAHSRAGDCRAPTRRRRGPRRRRTPAAPTRAPPAPHHACGRRRGARHRLEGQA